MPTSEAGDCQYFCCQSPKYEQNDYRWSFGFFMLGTLAINQLLMPVSPRHMGSKAKYRCHLGMLKVHKLIHSHLNFMKLENNGPAGECLNNNH